MAFKVSQEQCVESQSVCVSVCQSSGGGKQYLSDCATSSAKFIGGGIMVWFSFLGVGLCTLVPVKGTVNAAA